MTANVKGGRVPAKLVGDETLTGARTGATVAGAEGGLSAAPFAALSVQPSPDAPEKRAPPVRLKFSGAARCLRAVEQSRPLSRLMWVRPLRFL